MYMNIHKTRNHQRICQRGRPRRKENVNRPAFAYGDIAPRQPSLLVYRRLAKQQRKAPSLKIQACSIGYYEGTGGICQPFWQI